VSALQYQVSTRFKDTNRPPQSAQKTLDEAMVGITASQEWRQVEEGYFGGQR
jgi:hypothetical protein